MVDKFDCPGIKDKHHFKRVEPHSQSCSANGVDDVQMEYTVHVGEPYNNGDSCSRLHKRLEKGVKRVKDFQDNSIESWECEDDGSGDTSISFVTNTDLSQTINAALHRVCIERWRLPLL